jgi:hypothetical protein
LNSSVDASAGSPGFRGVMLMIRILRCRREASLKREGHRARGVAAAV